MTRCTFFGFLILCFPYALSNPLPQVACEARIETFFSPTRTETRIQCVNVGIDGLPLDIVLGRTPFFNTMTDQVFNFAQLASTVTVLEVSANGNVTISKSGLSSLPNLIHLSIESDNRRRNHLTISASEFKSTPRLTSLHISGFTAADTTIQAIGSLKNKLESLGITDCSPGKKLLKQVENFTKLKYNVKFSAVCDEGPFPPTTLKKSASTLKTLKIEYCNLPVIAAEMFKGMRNLSYLQLSSNRVTAVEAGAFDDLVELNYLNLAENRIRNLPNGLFEKMKNLMVVDLSKNQLENVSRNNFSHSMHFETLQLLI